MILLDDAQSTDQRRTSRLYGPPCDHWQITQTSDIQACLSEIESILQKGRYVAAAFSYECGEFLQGLTPKPSSTPLIEAFAFENVEYLSRQEVDQWIQNRLLQAPDQGKAGVLNLGLRLNQDEYAEQITAIHRLIESGDTYQVNYTFKYSGQIYGDPLRLYARLRQRQPSLFGAFFQGAQQTLLSVSPEWFVSCTDGELISKPMKGTLSAEQHQLTDLAADSKNRTENLMIVDLIRNDLGRISEIGSVTVPAMFEVEKFGDVMQMTSTVKSRLKKNLGLLDVLTATFPCGSVTGAPKKRTMEIIQDLETEPRGIYCGAIGWFDPPKQNGKRLGDFAMSVAIRTLEITPDHRFTLGIGSGITIDSDPKSEWEESLLKANFLVRLPSEVGLIETILAIPVEQDNLRPGSVTHLYHAPRLDAHLRRLSDSATHLNIPFKQAEAEKTIRLMMAGVDGAPVPRRLRLQLSPDGALAVTLNPMPEIKTDAAGRARAFWAADLLPPKLACIDADNPLYGHKTNLRDAYDAAWQAAEAHDGFDAVFVNTHGEVTEGGRSSLFIRKNENWLTPALRCGVLPGVMRSELLKDSKFNPKEAIITVDDVRRADEIILVNALRGIVPVYF